MHAAVPTFRVSPPPPLLFGAGSFDRIAEEAAERAAAPSAVIVADPFLAESGALDAALDGLARSGFAAQAFSDLRGEPKLSDVRRRSRPARAPES